jgi:hypothetical protein
MYDSDESSNSLKGNGGGPGCGICGSLYTRDDCIVVVVSEKRQQSRECGPGQT